jgi:transcriptional regulator with XRE-family HTH domain
LDQFSDIKINNNLWQARQRSKLELKQVTFLLAKGTNDLYRYENGVHLPHLTTALQLEIIYQTPIRLLFQPLFEFYKEKINGIKKRHPQLFQNYYWHPEPVELLRQEEFCFYGDLMKNHVPSQNEIDAITKHIITLNNLTIEYKQGKNPFNPE